jgi:hypothetical protein
MKLFMMLRPIVPSTCLMFKNFSVTIYLKLMTAVGLK